MYGLPGVTREEPGKYMEVYEMDQKMFCYQCEQTAGCAGCTGGTGVCGKTAETARLQDQLVGAMIGLARAAEGVECPGDRVYRTVGLVL